VNYTVSPVHNFERWMHYAEQLLEMKAHWLCLKDATGIIMPFDAYRIIKGIKERARDRLPVVLHTHDMGGAASMCHLMALLAGVDMIDTVMSPLSFGSAHAATETMVAALKDTPFDTGIDLKLLEEPARITREIREKYSKYETEYTGVNAEVLTHKIPGGMISNMVAQLKEAGRMDLMEAALKEVPSAGPRPPTSAHAFEPDRRRPGGDECSQRRAVQDPDKCGQRLCGGQVRRTAGTGEQGTDQEGPRR